MLPRSRARWPAAIPRGTAGLFGEVQSHGPVLAQLSPAERTAFVLRHFEGVGVEEIARVLGIESAPRAQHLPAYEAGPRPEAAGRSRPMIT